MKKRAFIIFGICVLGILFVSGCIGPEGSVKVVEGVEFQIRNAEYEAEKIIVTLSTNTSVENVRIDITDETDQLLCTRYKDLITGVTQIEMTDCQAKERITVSVSPPGGGIFTRGFTLNIPIPKVKIVNAEYKLGAELTLKLDANIDIKNTRVEVSEKRGSVLCTEYIDLFEGLNDVEPEGCGTRDKITVSVIPPEGIMTIKDFSLELPFLALKEGFKYTYRAACPDRGCSEQDTYIHVTKETSKYWQGIAGVKIREDKKAYLLRWMINKDDLDVSLTLPLPKYELLADVSYIDDIRKMDDIDEAGTSIMPLWMVFFKKGAGLDLNKLIKTHTASMDMDEQHMVLSTSDPALYNNYLAYTLDVEIYEDGNKKENVEFIISAAKPYLVIELNVLGEGPVILFKRVEQKEFSFDDYVGYSIEEWTPPPPEEE